MLGETSGIIDIEWDDAEEALPQQKSWASPEFDTPDIPITDPNIDCFSLINDYRNKRLSRSVVSKYESAVVAEGFRVFFHRAFMRAGFRIAGSMVNRLMMLMWLRSLRT